MCTGLKNTKQLKDQYCPYRTKNLHNDKIAMGNLGDILRQNEWEDVTKTIEKHCLICTRRWYCNNNEDPIIHAATEHNHLKIGKF